MNVTVESLTEAYGNEAKAKQVFMEISRLGRYGVELPSAGSGVVSMADGGLDLNGALDPENKAISQKAKARILELAKYSSPKGDKNKDGGVK